MKKIISLLMLMAVAVTAYGAIPITGLKLGGNADGNQKSFTNFYALELGGETRTNWPSGGETTWSLITSIPAVILEVVSSNGVSITNVNARLLDGYTLGQLLDMANMTGSVPVVVQQSVSHTNLADVNGAADVQHLTAAEKNAATGTVANARLDADLQTLAGNDGGSLTNVNAATLGGEEGSYYLTLDNHVGDLTHSAQVGITALGTITQGVWQGTAIGDSYLTKTGDWTGTFDGQQGAWYRDYANITNKDQVVVTNETSALDFSGAASVKVPTGTDSSHAVSLGQLISSNGVLYAQITNWSSLQGYKDFAQGTGIVPLVSLSGITSNQIDSTTDAAYRTGGGGGGGSGFPLTNDVNLAGYSMTNGNNITVTNSFIGKSLTLSGNATVSGGTITLNKTGQTIVSAKPQAGEGGSIKITDGDTSLESYIEMGKNSLYGSFGAPTGIVFMAQKYEGGGGIAPITFLTERFDIGDGATTNFSVSSAGAVRIGANMNANGKAVTNVNYITVTNYVTLPLGKFISWRGAGYTNDMTTVSNRMYIYHRSSSGVVTNYSPLD